MVRITQEAGASLLAIGFGITSCVYAVDQDVSAGKYMIMQEWK